MSSTGLLPYLSLSPPSTGENTNCMVAYRVSSQPPVTLAALISLPLICSISFGITGMIMPKPVQSMRMVAKIKPREALRDLSMAQISENLGKTNAPGGGITNPLIHHNPQNHRFCGAGLKLKFISHAFHGFDIIFA